MNGFLLLIPFLLIRFGLLSLLDRDAVRLAAHFAPMAGAETAAYWVYQLSNLVLFVSLCFLRVPLKASWLFWAGAGSTAWGCFCARPPWPALQPPQAAASVPAAFTASPAIPCTYPISSAFPDAHC